MAARDFLCLFVSLLLIGGGESGNILFYFGLSTYSHRIAVWPLVEALAAKGHNITFAQAFHPKTPSPPGVREFFPKHFEKQFLSHSAHLGDYNPILERINKGRIGTQIVVTMLPIFALNICKAFLADPETKVWAAKEKFDLVVIDGLFNECGLGLAAKFGAKTMIYGTTHPFPWNLEPFGVVPESSTISEIHFSHQLPLSFLERTLSTLLHLAGHYYREFYFFPRLEAIIRTELDFPEMPPMAELMSRVSLLLYNSHFSEELARSLPPFYVPVGGMHCEHQPGKPLPKDIEKFISESGDEGFILVSFGGEAKISSIPKETLDIFFKAFERRKVRILLKWEKERPKELPANVLTVPWYPQKEILASKKIRAFVTHGGLLSMQEAITFGVPMIAFPLFAEQDYNAFRLERTGRGIRLEISTLTQEQLDKALNDILTDKSYKLNTEKASVLFKDRPAKPVETAVWWTEYVLRNSDTSHLKPLAQTQFWFQRRLLDVWLFILAALLVIVFLCIFVFKKILSCLFSSLETTKVKSKSASTGKSKTKVKKT